MADLTDIQSAGTTKLVGSDNTGLEQTPVQATSQGGLHVNIRDNAGTEKGVVAQPIDVRLGDGSDTVSVAATGDLKVVDGLRVGGVYGRVSLPTQNVPVEMKVGASRLTNRKFIQVTCNNAGLFWGLSSAVTTTSGTPLANGQVLTFTIDPDSPFELWLVGNANTKTVQVVECP